MYIDNVDIGSFGGKLLKKDIQTSEYTSERTWSKRSLLPFKLSEKWSYRKVKLEIIVTGIDRNDTLMKISNIVSKVNECNIKFKDLELLYHLFLVTSNTEKTIAKNKYRLNLEFEGYAYKDYIIESANRIASKTINVSGNTNTPAVVEITPSIDSIDIVVNGLSDDPIIIKNLKQGQKVIINGEDGTVTCNGVNKYLDTDLWEFPRLKPGANSITLSKNSTDVTIKYKPRWI